MAGEYTNYRMAVKGDDDTVEYVFIELKQSDEHVFWDRMDKDKLLSVTRLSIHPSDPLRAISFALSLDDDHDMAAFLRDWNEGEWWSEYLQQLPMA